MIVENFSSDNICFPSQESILEPYSSWSKNFLKVGSSLQSKSILGRASFQSPSWELCFSNHDFKSWLLEKNSYAILFDGASKGNPGEAGAGGILLNLGGQVEHTFSWGIGSRTNNEAEWMDLIQSLHIL